MPTLHELIHNSHPAYLRELETLTNIDCGTYSKVGVDQVVGHVREIASRFGFSIQEFPQPTYGDCLYLRMTGTGRSRIFLIGHTDTVYPDGTVAQFPFRREGARILGPGTNDMKAGLLAGLYAMHALQESGFDDFAEIGMFVNSEEEIGSPVSREIYPAIARGADAGLVLESARSNGDIVSGRKGSGNYRLVVTGKSAHAGVDPQKGANAVVALAHAVTRIARLNGLRRGLTVNVGVVSGGTRSNVVPDRAEAVIDLRVVNPDDERAFQQELLEIIRETVVPGTRAQVSGGISNPPMPKTDATARLVAWAKEAAAEEGFSFDDVFTGGASDGNMIAGQGIPVLDGLGPVGGHDHNAADEYVIEGSIIPRVTLLARLVELIARNRRPDN